MADEFPAFKQSSINFKFEILSELNVAVIIWTGALSAETYMAFNKEFTAHPDFQVSHNRLYDLRQATMDLDSTALKKISKNLGKDHLLHGNRKVAILVSEDLHFGFMRMYTAIADESNSDFSLFRDRTKSLQWLGLPSGF